MGQKFIPNGDFDFVVVAEQFPAGAEFFVGAFPEAASVPQAAGLGVSDGGDRDGREPGQFRLREAVGPPPGGEGTPSRIGRAG